LAAHYGLTFFNKEDTTAGLSADTIAVDTIAQDSMVKHFMAYRNVRFYHRDMQGKCDSFIYIVSDSAGEMHQQPVIWNENNQISAERIDIRQKNGEIHQVELTTAAFVAAVDDSVQDFFNQIKGVSMLIHFAHNNIYRMDVFSGGQTVYYMRDNGKLSGVQKGASTDMVIRMKNKQIQKIDYLAKPETDIIPPRDIKVEDMILKGFDWQPQLRPRSRWEICSRSIYTSFRSESAQIVPPLFPVYEQILQIEQTATPYRYPDGAGKALE
jgi:hypothetical protein